MRASISVCFLVVIDCAAARTHARPVDYRCVATAYSQRGATELGVHAQEGIVAADPRIFPFGTVLRISGAGPYSGSFTVADTGSKVIGHRIDIFIRNRNAAHLFGRKVVRVHVLRWGTLGSH
jgi:3D (Asp-Asp-Asp) domain-containing protein